MLLMQNITYITTHGKQKTPDFQRFLMDFLENLGE
jgi:hypothetical protein